MFFIVFINMEYKYIKLSEYARKNCITYRTAYRHWENKIINGKQLSTGTILVAIDDNIISNIIENNNDTMEEFISFLFSFYIEKYGKEKTKSKFENILNKIK